MSTTAPAPLVQIIGTKRLHKATCSQIGERARRTTDNMTDAEIAKASKATCCRPLLADALIGGAALRLADANGTTPPALAKVAAVTAVEVDGVKVAETRRIDATPSVSAPAQPTQAAASTGTKEARTFEGGDVHTCRTCATERPVTAFPTVGGGRRGTECRACRDARRKARTEAA